MGRPFMRQQSISFDDAFHSFKAQEYTLQKRLVDAVLLSNYNEADQLKTELDTGVLLCSEETQTLLEKGRGKFIGQCFFHRKFGYRGVIFKPDVRCRMDESWVQTMGVRNLERGPDQPFYHCLVDVRDRPGVQTTYVAEDNVEATTDAFSVEHPLLTQLFTAVPELECYIGTDYLDAVLTDYED